MNDTFAALLPEQRLTMNSKECNRRVGYHHAHTVPCLWQVEVVPSPTGMTKADSREA
jgi:hypothetical protein